MMNTTIATKDGVDDNIDDRGFNTSFSLDDLAITIVMSGIWSFLMTPLYVILIRSNPFYSKSKSNSVSPTGHQSKSKSKSKSIPKEKVEKKEDVISWRFGLTAATLFYLRTFDNSMVWITWICTYNYDVTSPSYIFDVLLQFINAFAVSSLYLYFILRLYTLYSDGVIVQYSNKIYIVLVIFNIGLFVSMLLLCTSWIWWDVTIYARANLGALFCEAIMAISLGVLFSKPLIKLSAKIHGTDKFKGIRNNNCNNNNITVNKNSDIEIESDSSPSAVAGDDDAANASLKEPETRVDRSRSMIDRMKNDKLLNLSTKLLILSGIALGSTTVLKIMNFSAYEYCANVDGDKECWFVYVSYTLWPLDASLNIFCILCAFKNGNKYYVKVCDKIHQFVLFSWVAKYFDKEVERSQTDLSPAI